MRISRNGRLNWPGQFLELAYLSELNRIKKMDGAQFPQGYGDYARSLLAAAASPANTEQLGYGSRYPMIAAAQLGKGYFANALGFTGNSPPPGPPLSEPGAILPETLNPHGGQAVTLDAINKEMPSGQRFTLEDLNNLLKSLQGPSPAY
jgi:hypothetical protein